MSASSSLLEQPSENIEDIEDLTADNVFLSNVLEMAQTMEIETIIGDDQTIDDIRMTLPAVLRKLVDAGETEVEGSNGPVDIENYLSRHVDAENEPEGSSMDDALNTGSKE